MLDASSENLVVRTSWVIGDGENFVAAILRHAGRGGPIRVVDDQRGRPTCADPLALAVVEAARLRLHGIVHVAGDGSPCSWAELAEVALRLTNRQVPIHRVSSEEYRTAATGLIAPRPSNSVLCLAGARAASLPLAPWPISLADHLADCGDGGEAR